MIIKKSFLLFFLVLLILNSSAQNAMISGSIKVDSSDINSAVLVKLFTSDSILIKTNQADSSGNFKLYVPKTGEYMVEIEKPSYEIYYSPNFKIDSTNPSININLGYIILKKEFHNLHPVTVLSKKSFIERKFNKTIVNISQSIFAQGNSLFELLPILPGIKVDASGGITINGKSNILFLVDGKGQVVPGDQATEMLKSINASSIEKIEIIHNPSARYDASVGIVVNIITLKKKSQSDVHAGYGSQFYPVPGKNGLNDSKANIGSDINTKVGPLNINSTIDYRKSTAFEESTDQMDFKTFTPQIFRTANSIRTANNANINFVLGLNYDINKKQFLDLNFNTNQYLFRNNNNLTSINFQTPLSTVPDSNIISNGKYKSTFLHFNTLNAKYVFELPKAGEEIAFFFDYNNFAFNRINDYQNIITRKQSPLDSNWLFKTNWFYKVNISSFKLDYTYPISQGLFLDAGGKLSFVKNISDFQQNQIPNNFLYNEFIQAGYVSLRKESDKFNYEIGIRLENTHSKGNILNTDTSLTRNYLNFFPTVTTQYSIDSNSSLTFSYKRTIVRPNYSDFNPATILNSPFDSYTGNNQLNPKITTTFQLGYVHKDYALTLINDYATSVNGSFIDSISTAYNIFNKVFSYAYVNRTSLELDIPIKFNSKWASDNSISGYFTSAKLFNGVKKYFSFDLNTNHTFQISSSLSMNFMVTYSYYDQVGYDKSFPILNAAFTLQKSWMNKYIVNLSFNDILGTSKFRLSNDYGYLSQTSTGINNNNRNGRISFRYKFNSGKLFSKRDKSSKDDNSELRF